MTKSSASHISRRVQTAALLFTVVVAALLSLHGLNNNAFWDDEANTAIFARNWLRTGTLTAFDGVNVVGFRQGAELNGKLENVYMPPVQYYVAGLGLRLFGSSTLGGRLPFVFAGLLAIGVLALFVKWHLRGDVPLWVATALVALCPAYLLFIRQCRYYSIVVLLTLTVLVSFVRDKSHRGSRIVSVLVAAVAAWLLMFTNYLNAAALACCLPLFFTLRRYRNLTNVCLVSGVYVILLAAGFYVLRTANPLAISVSYKDTITGFHRLWRLFYWHLSGLPRFEFFPLVAPILVLWLSSHSRSDRIASLLRETLFLCAVMVVYSATIAALSPQTVTESTTLADMRYSVSLVPIGAVATACALCALWHSSPMSGPIGSLVAAAMLVATNAFSSALGGWAPLRSTLYEYIRENAHDYVTGNEAVIGFLKRLPKGRVIRVIPDFMTYPAMFYAPRQHYCCQLPDDFFIGKTPTSVRLPDYVFNSRVLPDYILVGADVDPEQLLGQCTAAFGPGRYRLLPEVGTDYRDHSRPEIPWHSFGPVAGKRRRGFTVLERTGLRAN